ncbi:MAG: hypothetical protein OEN55_04130 [Alphaproteobacteria bacterium]|nr:hypothetical protein [Alphaproteobacteria bacterium]
MKKGLWAVLVLFLAMPAMPAWTETPSLRLTAPAWMLRDDNPLRAGKPYDGAVPVELPGYRYDPPMTVPAAPRAWPPQPDVVEVDQILSHLKVEAELGGEVLIHAAGFFKNAIIVLAAVERRPPVRVVLPLLQGRDGEWRVDGTVLDEPLIDALHAAWDESGWIEVIDTELRRPDN